MSKSKERLLQKQKEREDKLLERVKSGEAVRMVYKERKKKPAMPNCKCSQNTAKDEMADRQEKVERATILYRQMLPGLLKKLGRIKDPRQPEKIKHKMTVLMVYGILLFVWQTGSRRQANKEMSRAIFLDNVSAMFPEFESIPHADTLARLLEKIDVEQIQECLVELLKDLMRRKKFKSYLINKRYLIAVDGTQKFLRNYQWQTEALERHVGGEERIPQYYVYVLESVLVLDNGIVLPVLTEMLDNTDWVKGETKQDCERKAFKRLAPKLYRIFGKGKVTLIADGLYACGPVIRKCREYQWEFMIVLKEDGMPDVWEEGLVLMTLEPSNNLRVMWGDRQQDFFWADDIEYEYVNGSRYTEILHVVICYETWTEKHTRSTGVVEEKRTRYAWISSRPLNKKNVFMRCTKLARYRWKIENNFLIEKHEGYHFEHCYSYNWTAMLGFHYLMKAGHFLNAMAINSEILLEYVNEKGIRGFIVDLKVALNGAVLDMESIARVVESKHVWKLKVST
ncbi:MAG: transposase family protein [Clostridiales bacterium]|nr:transposase family protein [Clostridiales bacterium]